ncbi:MAG TPA: prepilin-type N-terminal cleavage/methylation domain-containing protein [Candidatus Angelobacter sp.]|nr:prepilin-type N-terminal cleavage/methylation domain-containing protein [Candidatus Angelobacter sp.]
MNSSRKIFRGNSKGFSLIELMVAMFILTVGVLGGMVMIILGMTRDNSNRVDTTATNAAQAVLEQIAGAPANTNPTFTVTDCLGNNLQINSTGNAAAGGAGAPLLSNGDMNWSVAAVNGYQMNYTVFGNNGLQTTYDVRWNVTLVGPGNSGKLITVAARQPFTATSKGIGFISPVTLRTIVGM